MFTVNDKNTRTMLMTAEVKNLWGGLDLWERFVSKTLPYISDLQNNSKKSYIIKELSPNFASNMKQT